MLVLTTVAVQRECALNQLEEAIADFDEAIRLDPNDAGAYNNRGVVKKWLNQLEEALIDFDEAIHLNPDDADAYSNRAEMKAMGGQKGAAIEELQSGDSHKAR